MSKFLFTSDIHLSPRPREAYRWTIFQWLRTQALSRNVDAVFILGDITDQKDGHTNAFINRIVDEVRALREAVEVYLITGNHDYSDPKAPLLRFLEGCYHQPTGLRDVRKGKPAFDEHIMLLPHVRYSSSSWVGMDFKEYDLALCHQTFAGSQIENGLVLAGGVAPARIGARVVISGDVHVPQRIEHVRYCGSPHPVRFGDSFQPRVLFWDDGKLKSINRVTMRRLVIETDDLRWLASEADISDGDQVKLRLKLPRSRFGEWEQLRREASKVAEARNFDLCGLELLEQQDSKRVRLRGAPTAQRKPADVFDSFCKANAVEPELTSIGKTLLQGVKP